MFILLTKYSTSASIFKLILMLIAFVFVLLLSYFFTKWYAKSGFVKKRTNNISVIESYQMAPGKYIYIIKVGDKYITIASAKDNIVKLTELSEEELVLKEDEIPVLKDVSFKEVINNMMKTKNKK